MDYIDLIMSFSKMDWSVIVGYYCSFLTWGIEIGEKTDPDNNYIKVEKFEKCAIVLYDISLMINGKKMIKKENVNCIDYAKTLKNCLEIVYERTNKKYKKNNNNE
ncbi:hypothetical protein [Romboutsia sp.]|uniref:hypothetical protein n=1 Tax=Romboutsia sp. TaxID=1965302 RepID=UPI002D00E33D|nr:hypothetical protein [Romboutsia sp.]HSQ89144.1 hypothetical protein [Romboutsia sp.]